MADEAAERPQTWASKRGAWMRRCPNTVSIRRRRCSLILKTAVGTFLMG